MKKIIHIAPLAWVIFLCYHSNSSYGQDINNSTRIEQSVNSNWFFHKGDKDSAKVSSKEWETVSLPHTWNIGDTRDDTPGYYRGIGWYQKTLHIPPSWKNKTVFLHFNGVSQVAEIYINGIKAGSHIGGYTAFDIPLNNYLRFGSNKYIPINVEVKVDNSHDENIPPLSADFTFYGGIYRDVSLLAVNAIHFNSENSPSDGIYISTPTVTEKSANVLIRGCVRNDNTASKKVRFVTSIYDAVNRLTVQKEQFIVLDKEVTQFEQRIDGLKNPRLWSPDSPYLYRVVSSVYDARGGSLLDEKSNALGFRWFRFDAEKGFFLNGQPLKLVGASRHQDYEGMGNALPTALHTRDVELLKAMGGNFLRIAHYPQDKSLVETCDRLGILASIETPEVDRITESKEFAENSKNMQVEMIRQNYNHPSVILWGYMNEILLKPRYNEDSVKQQAYFRHVYLLARALDSLTRKEDPYRYTFLPANANLELYKKTGLTQIPMVMGWNIYRGWYSPGLDSVGNYMDEFHKALPGIPLMITEYGADGDPRIRSLHPQRYDKSVEYETLYHRTYMRECMQRPYLAALMVWNLADFSAEARAESMPHINNKGLLTMDRQPKDAYFFYQSQLVKQPYVKIASHLWKTRSGPAAAPDSFFCCQPVEIFTNQKSISLYLNGKLLGNKPAQEGIATFEVPFQHGNNQLMAQATTDKTLIDVLDIDFRLLPKDFKSLTLPFTELNINIGDDRMYVDEILKQIWLPEQPYQQGSWGYIGGHAYKEKNKRPPLGSSKNILGTDDDPLYQTQRTGIEAFKLDVPDGQYEITLHFAELATNTPDNTPVYLLSEGTKPEQQTIADRSFDIYLNGNKILEDISSQTYLLPLRVYKVKTSAIIRDGKGITLDFKAKKGETILNALQVRKIL